MLHEFDRDTGRQGDQQLADSVMNAMDDINNKRTADKALAEKEKWVYYILEFPVDTKLSVEEIYEDYGKDYELEVYPCDVTSYHLKRPGIANTSNKICWDVIDKRFDSYKVGRSSTKKLSKLASKYGHSLPTPQNSANAATFFAQQQEQKTQAYMHHHQEHQQRQQLEMQIQQMQQTLLQQQRELEQRRVSGESAFHDVAMSASQQQPSPTPVVSNTDPFHQQG